MIPTAKITEERIHTDHVRYPDHIEIGKAGARLHIAFNADRPEEAIDRVDEALVVLDYGRKKILDQVSDEIKRIKEARN